MNQQAIEKLSNRADGLLEVNSIFYTIQGEGPFCGTPAVFIRLAGCNLQCPQCDTEYTERNPLSILYIANYVSTFANKGLVVITGGEPFRQKIGPLIRILINAGYYVQVETNGTLPPPADINWGQNQDISLRSGAYIVCSPKAGKMNSHLEREACAFKYVVTSGDILADGLPNYVLQHSASPFVARPSFKRNRVIYLQPADSKDVEQNKKNTKQAVDSCMDHGYVLQLQVHKIIEVE